jgi:hypothetical protein
MTCSGDFSRNNYNDQPAIMIMIMMMMIGEKAVVWLASNSMAVLV